MPFSTGAEAAGALGNFRETEENQRLGTGNSLEQYLVHSLVAPSRDESRLVNVRLYPAGKMISDAQEDSTRPCLAEMGRSVSCSAPARLYHALPQTVANTVTAMG